MIGWRNPAALAGLAALAAPVLIHLLRRQRARRVRFPSLRFIRPLSTAAVRPRTPSDLLLLALRLAIVALAAAAVAQPVLLTGARVRAWNTRTVRALVIDTSDSMRPFASAAGERASAEARDAADVLRIETADLADGLRRGAAWLETAAPARREVVVFSDLHLGALDQDALSAVPSSAGLRFVQIGTAPGGPQFVASTLLSGQRHETVLVGAATQVRVTPGPQQRDGLRILAAERDTADVQRLLEVLEDAGTPAPSPAEPIVVAFEGGRVPPTTQVFSHAWMRTVVARLPPGLTAGLTRDGELLIEVAAAPSSLEAAAAVRAVLLARAGSIARPEREVLRIPASELAAWSRPSAPVDAGVARHADVSDARWAWLGVLALLGAETYVRRRGAQAKERQEHASAA